MRVLTAAQMREADRRTIEEIGIPSSVLMEIAGREVVSAMESAFDWIGSASVAILVGRGNNGGDGCVVARTLAQRGVDVCVFVVGSREDVRGDARVNLDILGRLGVPLTEIVSVQDWENHGVDVLASDIIVDALFGTGLGSPLIGIYAAVISDVNASGVPVVSIDLPSGLSADGSEPIGPHIRAMMTVTLGARKLALAGSPGEDAAGIISVADIGVPARVVDGIGDPVVHWLDQDFVRKLVPARDCRSHKGTFGHVLIVAGSTGKTGAAYLAAMGALRSGVGLATVATPASALPVVAALGPEYMTLPLDEERNGTVAAAALNTVLAHGEDVIAVGPGIGTGPAQRAFVEGLLARSRVPLVLDADALTVLAPVPATDGECGSLASVRADDMPRIAGLEGRDDRPVIVTPHPGEMSRLTGIATSEIQRNRIGVARSFALRHGVFVVLKGHRTIIATPSGHVSVNPTGNPGMATGGSGDVLTGMVAAWLAQLKDPEAACRLAVYLHGAAGDLAAGEVGGVALMARDILGHLGGAMLALTARDGGRPCA